MADRAKEILDGCAHRPCTVCDGRGRLRCGCSANAQDDSCHVCNFPDERCVACGGTGRGDSPCRACADRAVEAAREEEREACAKAIAKAKNEAPDRSKPARVDWICAANFIAAEWAAARARAAMKKGSR